MLLGFGSQRAASMVLLSIFCTRISAQSHLNVSRVPHTFLNVKMLNAFQKQGWKTSDPSCDRYIFSRKFEGTCMKADVVLPLLLTGTTRGVRNFATDVLRLAKCAEGGSFSWAHGVNNVAFDVPYPFSAHRAKWWQLYGSTQSVLRPRYKRVVHLTRCPLRELISLMRPNAPSIRFVEKITRNPPITSPCAESYDCEESTLAERLGWATSAYVALNEHIERYADDRVKVEQIVSNEIFQSFCSTCSSVAARGQATKLSGTEAQKCRREIYDNREMIRTLNASLDEHGEDKDVPLLVSLRDIKTAIFPKGISGQATIEEYVAMGRRYGYEDDCVVGRDDEEVAAIHWSSRRREISTTPSLKIPWEDHIVTKAGVEACITDDAKCSNAERTCPEATANRDCLQARIPFRTSYRQLKCCFHCCIDYWISKATRFGENMKYHVQHAHDLYQKDIGHKVFNPDSGDFGLDPFHNLLIHPHVFSAISDVHMHPTRGCHVPDSNDDSKATTTTIASLYHYKPDEAMIPTRRGGRKMRKTMWTANEEFKRCVDRLRESNRLVVDLFDPTKQLPGSNLANRSRLFMANNIGDLPPGEVATQRTMERPIGVRGVSLWQAILEHPSIENNAILRRREKMFLCCCMNVDHMHKGRLNHTKILAKHPSFNCPVDQNYRQHHIGAPRNDAGNHEIESEFLLMLNNKYGESRRMTGMFDAHMPVLMFQHKFVYSPNGVGEQCYREYEALVSGAIPVLDDSKYKNRREMLRSFPTVRVPDGDWAMITPQYLEEQWKQIERKDYDVSKLYLPYWYDVILNSLSEHEWRKR